MSLLLNIVTTGLSLLALALSPVVLAGVLLVNFALNLFILSVQLVSSLLPNKQKERKRIDMKNQPFISIHVPTHNEPPYIVKATLTALSKLNYSNYEVLVIDNNTKDKNLWLPLQEYCAVLGEKFRFFHVERLKGYKAGALNYIMPKADERAEYVAVIDADYIVKPDFVKKALQYFVDEHIGFVQFPQSFYNVGRGNLGIKSEYRHFFLTYMNMSNYMGSLLTTGTLTVFNLNALKKAGRFNTHALTEDAEVGLKLNIAGFDGVYVDEAIGEGLIPFDLDSYEKQKRRWAMGNAQIIKDNMLRIFSSKTFNWKEKIAILAQLTAWLNLTMIPIAAIIAIAIWSLLGHGTDLITQSALAVAVVNLSLFFILKLISFLAIFKREHNSFLAGLRAFMIHIGMNEVYAYSFWTTLVSPNAEFIRTNKFLNGRSKHPILATSTEIIIMATVTVLAALSYREGQWFLALSLLSIIPLFIFVFYVAYEFRYTKKYSEAAFNRLNIKYGEA
jgi:cellulose synthase/poly-beta-1,6-N-acetylglucosamine synthase-like glycosyltransferase